jgi:hypothetical protein
LRKSPKIWTLLNFIISESWFQNVFFIIFTGTTLINKRNSETKKNKTYRKNRSRGLIRGLFGAWTRINTEEKYVHIYN